MNEVEKSAPTRSKKSRGPTSGKAKSRGQLRIGDHWNAITILALSQSNPLKAIAEFVENSIDAGASLVHIFRGRKKGATYLRIVDNGRGIPRSETGEPDFKYVATHIGDSIKRHFKAKGAQGIQGEFGIGLLSFWTVGERLTMRSAGADGHVYQMTMTKGQPGYEVSRTRALFSESGTELVLQPLLPGLRQLSGEKLQWYLGSELRNRLIDRGVKVLIHDLVSRNEYQVEPQRFSGRRLALCVPEGLKAEIYVGSADPAHRVALYRQGTRVLEDLAECERLDGLVWRSGYLSGYVDWPELQLTPGTRQGIVQDERFEQWLEAVRQLEQPIRDELALLKRAEDETATQATQVTIRKAFRDAFESLPAEEYDWFEMTGREQSRRGAAAEKQGSVIGESVSLGADDPNCPSTEGEERPAPAQAAFFEFPGPLQSARVAPASSVLGVSKLKYLRAVTRDRKGTPVSNGLTYSWKVIEGGGTLEHETSQEAVFHAPGDPGITRLELRVTQGELSAQAEAMITVTASLLEPRPDDGSYSKPKKGLPDFTYERASGDLWRSRFDRALNVVVVNSGHRDFLFASGKTALKIRYLVRLFSKELVLANFPGMSASELMERLIEVSMRAEESLR